MLNRNRDLDRLPLEIGRQSIIRFQLVTVEVSAGQLETRRIPEPHNPSRIGEQAFISLETRPKTV
jgi:hypothetical protein